MSVHVAPPSSERNACEVPELPNVTTIRLASVGSIAKSVIERVGSVVVGDSQVTPKSRV